MIADELKAEHTRVYQVRFVRPFKTGIEKIRRPSCPGILMKHGIQTAIITDHPVIPLQYLTLAAGLAVREGADYEAALKAITIERLAFAE